MGRNDEPNDLFPVCVAVSADISQNIDSTADIDYIPRGSFSIVQVLRFHCKDRLLLCAGSWV